MFIHERYADCVLFSSWWTRDEGFQLRNSSLSPIIVSLRRDQSVGLKIPRARVKKNVLLACL